LRYITVLTNPQIRRLLHTGTLQLGLSQEQICEVESGGVCYVLRKNEAEAEGEQHRLEDKLEKLESKIAARNEEIKSKPRSQPAAGQRKLEAWVEGHTLTGLVELKLDGGALVLERQQAAIATSLELAGCFVVTTTVSQPSMTAQEVHESHVGLQKVKRDFRAMKTGLLEVRPVFVRKKSRTRGHVFCCLLALKLSREMERRLREAFGTTDSNPHAITLPDALASLSHLCLLHYQIDEKMTVTKLRSPVEARNKS
jgi:transposase